MTPIFLVTVHPHKPGAKTKANANAGNDPRAISYAINARDADEAWRKLCAAYQPHDKRPLAGRSYLRQLRVGHFVHVPEGYAIGYNYDGSQRRATSGHVSELITDNAISIKFNGYPNDFVDFALSELVTARIL